MLQTRRIESSRECNCSNPPSGLFLGMVVHFICECGWRFTAGPDLAGQVVQCPHCGQAVQLPQPAPASEVAKPPQPIIAPRKKMLLFGKGADKLQTAALFVGSVVTVCLIGALLLWVSSSYHAARDNQRAEREGETLAGPALENVEIVDKFLDEKAKRARLRDLAAKFLSEGENAADRNSPYANWRPWARQKDRSFAMSRVIYAPHGPLKADQIGLGYLIDDYRSVVHLRLAAFWDAPIMQTGLSAGSYLGNHVKRLETITNVSVIDVDFVTIGFRESPGGLHSQMRPYTIVVRTKAAYRQDEVLSERGDPVAAGEHHYYRCGGGLAVWFPDPRTIVLGTETEVGFAMQHPGAKELRAAVDWIDFHKHSTVITGYDDDEPLAQTLDIGQDTMKISTARHRYIREAAEQWKTRRDRDILTAQGGSMANRFRGFEQQGIEVKWHVTTNGGIVNEIADLEGITSDSQRIAAFRWIEGVLVGCSGVSTSGIQHPTTVESRLLTAVEELKRSDLDADDRTKLRKRAASAAMMHRDEGVMDNMPAMLTALQESGDPALQQKLFRVFCKTHDPVALIGLSKVIGEANLETPQQRERFFRDVRPKLKHYLKYGDPPTVIACCNIIRQIEDTLALDTILTELASSSANPQVRLAANNAIAVK